MAYVQSSWDLTHLFKAPQGKDFDAFLKKLETNIVAIESSRMQLDSFSLQKIILLLKDIESVEQRCSVLICYSYLWFSENTKSQEARAFQDRMKQFTAAVGNRILFFHIWFKSLDEKSAQKIIAGAGEYRYYFQKLLLEKPYTLSEKEEQILLLKETTGSSAFFTLYSLMTTSFSYDFYVGKKVKKLNKEQLTVYVRSSSAAERKQAYELLLEKYAQNKDMLGELYKLIVSDWKNDFLTLRGYAKPISPRNLGNNISDKAVEVMLASVQKNISVFHRYFLLKTKLLKMKKMTRYDLYAPFFVKEKKRSFSDAVTVVLDSYRHFSPQMEVMGRKILEEKHVHSLIQEGKMHGAYCYDVAGHTPYVLINYLGMERDVSTLAHELGHGVHDLLTKKQVSLLSHPPLVFAETASVFAEMLLTEKLLEDEKNVQSKQALLMSKLDDMYATIIRQSYFVLFEKKAHEAVEKGATIDQLSALYLANLEEQFGSSVVVSKNFQYEWLYIPHIYNSPFYCYSYSFGNLLTLALYAMYKKEGKAFVPKYLKFLSYGGSKSPKEIALELGIDLESEAFWNRGFVAIEVMLDALEDLSKKAL
ncbi:MAG: M3 family oligoendopeptidase [bacterium]|nr:M3 family oligoendopeptidase [bacterium]